MINVMTGRVSVSSLDLIEVSPADMLTLSSLLLKTDNLFSDAPSGVFIASSCSVMATANLEATGAASTESTLGIKADSNLTATGQERSVSSVLKALGSKDDLRQKEKVAAKAPSPSVVLTGVVQKGVVK